MSPDPFADAHGRLSASGHASVAAPRDEDIGPT